MLVGSVRFRAEALDWADLVFHVLAHVEASAELPASLWDRRYVHWCRGLLGPAEARPLAEDARVLGSLLSRHDQLAAVQVLAWLFADGDQAARVADRDLDALASDEVADPGLLSGLGTLGPVVEVLRCACELERPEHAQLPAAQVDLDETRQAFEPVRAAAPLEGMTVRFVRALGLRGRIRGQEIWVGVPGTGPSAEHVAWQAAHEATVGEVARRGQRRLAERDVEHVALLLLSERAAAVGLAEAHRRWLAHLGGLPELSAHALSAVGQDVLVSAQADARADGGSRSST